ncbi:4-hydroxy-tetrahydrodipicolinate synthase [Candidatus Sneabacter namystus]|uniref:4-hydroxy-tetrahydrodipicolinate synthase n=1 Tax=Candidatus Sneabacter namystus TaxID=2601646 RepID=A0A5C0UJ85_9RICK|nr:4-hydroxy-tetrahydrodipicolinate synthase [Candidatus Sneabacter namystus]QEK39573.1 4-hydroxy-tetrahydrodipicolinate synthase [Candidatus Sneabacter namystus]
MVQENFFKGVFTALVTPFCNDAIDYLSLEKILVSQIEAKVNGVVIAGSTGEGLLLSKEEYDSLLEFVVNFTKGKAKIVASCTSLHIKDTVAMAQLSQCKGLDGIMCAPPPYLRLSEKGIIEYFNTISNNVDIPVMLYSVPQRVGYDFSDLCLTQLSKNAKILAIKCGNEPASVIQKLGCELSDKINFLCGEDRLTLDSLLKGASGCVSVVSNMVPRAVVHLYNLVQTGAIKEADRLNEALSDLFDLVTLENNPAAIKYCLSVLGICKEEVREPLCQLSNKSKEFIRLNNDKMFRLVMSKYEKGCSY